jgi:hypothetical protein
MFNSPNDAHARVFLPLLAWSLGILTISSTIALTTSLQATWETFPGIVALVRCQ